MAQTLNFFKCAVFLAYPVLTLVSSETSLLSYYTFFTSLACTSQPIYYTYLSTNDMSLLTRKLAPQSGILVSFIHCCNHITEKKVKV